MKNFFVKGFVLIASFCPYFATAQELIANVLTHVTSCVAPDGSASAYILNGDAIDYDFEWFVGAAPTAVPDFIGQSVMNLSEGVYTVQAVHKIDQSIVGPAAIMILNNTTPPEILSILSSPVTSCDEPDGELGVVMNGTSVYIFTWHEGVSAAGPVVGSEALVDELLPGFYTVVATDAVSGCQSNMTGEVLDSREFIVDVATVSELTSCSAPNGALSAMVEGVTSGYSFEWFEGTDVSGVPVSIDALVAGLSVGTYTVVATNTTSGCQAQAEGSIVDAIIPPDVTLEVTSHLSSCVVTNGAISASVDGEVAGYSFHWYRNNDLIAAGNIVNGLPVGSYTVRVTDNTTQCMSEDGADITDVRQTPDVAISLVSPLTFCLFPNGALAASVGGETVGYSFEWFAEDNGASVLIATSPSVSDLTDGVYTVRVTHNGSGCSGIETAIVPNELVYPDPTITVEDDVLSVPFSDGYGYEWYLDDVLLSEFENLVVAEETGMYRVIVTTPLGCQAQEEVYVVITAIHDAPTYLSFYPNPTTGPLWIKPDYRFRPMEFEITDVHGRSVFQQDVRETGASYLINLEPFSPGVYFVTLKMRARSVRYKVLVE